METSITTSKGEVVIPRKLRKKYGIKPGTKVVFLDRGGEIIIRALTKVYFQNLAEWLKGEGDVLGDLMKEKRKESVQ